MTTDTLPERDRASLVRNPPSRPSIGMLVLRIVFGVILIAHGLQKLLVFGLPGTTESFASIGIPLPAISTPLVVFVELVGGTAIVLGLGTRIFAALATVSMLVATFVVHLPFGLFVDNNGFEYTLILSAVGIALVVTGPGRFSIDALIGRRRR